MTEAILDADGNPVGPAQGPAQQLIKAAGAVSAPAKPAKVVKPAKIRPEGPVSEPVVVEDDDGSPIIVSAAIPVAPSLEVANPESHAALEEMLIRGPGHRLYDPVRAHALHYEANGLTPPPRKNAR